MFEALFGSVAVKILAVITGLAGVVTGLAVTDAIPGLAGLGGESAVQASSRTPAGETSVSAGAQTSDVAVPGPSDEAIAVAQNATDLAGEAQGIALQVQAAAQECVASVTAAVNGLTARIPGATSPAQAQALVAEAGVIGETARECAAIAGSLGQTAVGLARQATDQLTAALGTLGVDGLGAPVGPGQEALDTALVATDLATDSADGAMNLALSIADQVTKLATGAVSSALGIQAQALEFALQAAGTAQGAAQGVAPTVPGIPSIPGAGGLPIPGGTGNPAGMGMDAAQMGFGFAKSIMGGFMGGFGGDGGFPIPGGFGFGG